ncbi:MAG: hypothetical protein HOW97_43295 [Catenulispora sp.]|nr:hypothetical protein [Catenulispora sp.]
MTAGCGGSSGTIGAGGGTPTTSTSSSPAPSPSTTSSQTASPTPEPAPPTTSTTSTGPAPAPSTSSQSGHWQPTGDLANAEQVDESVGADQTVTVLWPKGQPADHALSIKLKANRSGDKLLVTMAATNRSGQKVSLLTGAFGGANALDADGQGMNFEPFDKDWTLTNPGNSPYIEPDQPLNGVIVLDAPKTASFNLFWTQAVNIGGIILVRDIPISG